jgi:hypothetical protein
MTELQRLVNRRATGVVVRLQGVDAVQPKLCSAALVAADPVRAFDRPVTIVDSLLQPYQMKIG